MRATLDVLNAFDLIFGLMNAVNAAIFRIPMENYKDGYENI